MPRTTVTILLLCLFVACKTENQAIQKKEYPRMVGDISEDLSIDNQDFKVCDSLERASPYYYKKESFAYEGEKAAVLQVFKEEFVSSKDGGQNGWIRIRFIVNCEGQIGRFRVLESDFNYQSFKFDPTITKQLLKITKNLDGWKTFEHGDHNDDYYQYLIFKIENGQIAEILP